MRVRMETSWRKRTLWQISPMFTAREIEQRQFSFRKRQRRYLIILDIDIGLLKHQVAQVCGLLTTVNRPKVFSGFGTPSPSFMKLGIGILKYLRLVSLVKPI